MSNRKGQGAMEYLMTYGWAILVVLIVGIVLWQLGIFQMGTSGTGYSEFSQVKPVDFAFSTTRINAVYINGAGQTINITSIRYNSTLANCAVNPTGGLIVAPGINQNTTCAVTLTSGVRYSFDVDITYKTMGTELVKHSKGKMWGTPG